MISKTEKSKMRTWVEIDRKAIRNNYKIFKKIIGKDCILMGVVKSNAYGHGLVPFSKELVKCGVGFLGVDSFEEALELRSAGIKTKILVFGYTSPACYSEAAEKNISLTISGITALNALLKIKNSKKIKIHIKADTGLGRQGFQMEEMRKVAELVSARDHLEVEGIYSHLAVGEDPKQKSYTKSQVEKLNKWDAKLKDMGCKPLKHICATASTMFFPEFHFDMVRIGIGMYGLWPSVETRRAVGRKYRLASVLSWKAIVAEVKNMKKGAKIGYDLTEELDKDSMLAVVPVGYWHGYPRSLSSVGSVYLVKKYAKITGRVSMDMIVIRVLGGMAAAGEEVEIVGKKVPAEEVAVSAETINYEIVTRINPLIKRLVV